MERILEEWAAVRRGVEDAAWDFVSFSLSKGFDINTLRIRAERVIREIDKYENLRKRTFEALEGGKV